MSEFIEYARKNTTKIRHLRLGETLEMLLDCGVSVSEVDRKNFDNKNPTGVVARGDDRAEWYISEQYHKDNFTPVSVPNATNQRNAVDSPYFVSGVDLQPVQNANSELMKLLYPKFELLILGSYSLVAASDARTEVAFQKFSTAVDVADAFSIMAGAGVDISRGSFTKAAEEGIGYLATQRYCRNQTVAETLWYVSRSVFEKHYRGVYRSTGSDELFPEIICLPENSTVGVLS